MLSNWPIRYKFLLQLVLLLVIVAALSATAMVGFSSYRNLVKSISGRAAELPLATQLGQNVSDLRVTLTEIRQLRGLYETSDAKRPSLDGQILHQQFEMNLQAFNQTLVQYQKQLNGNEWKSPSIGNSHREREKVRKIKDAVTRITVIDDDPQWILDDALVGRVDGELDQLQTYCAELPSFLHARMQNFTDEVRVKYRSLIYAAWITSTAVAVILTLLVRLFFAWIFGPLQVLIAGSRRVAGGDFDHRIQLKSRDEMAELARAMNDMTDRFQAIRDDLDRQVHERTMQVVRSEQLASVGFLAAGVAHEINNPMASIAMCAESLERRLDEGAVPDREQSDGARKYLRMIQDEAFRCKEITASLLDFSRSDDGQRQNTDLRELIAGVIEMVRHLGKNQQKEIELLPCKSVIARINPQEIKQVLLNLITNALDSIDAGGKVEVELGIQHGQAAVVVSDNGCGMTEEVQANLFEPFFTRRRGGQGTGLGLSIVYRIVAEHEGTIEAESDGPNQGSRFRVALPLAGSGAAQEGQHQAA